MDSGIYCIENKINGKKYIGQSIRMSRRTYDYHKNSVALLEAIKKYGIENFEIYVLEYCDSEDLDAREEYYIKKLNSHATKHGYNISWGGNSPMKGKTLSEQTKMKISVSRKGIVFSQETKNKMSNSAKGKVLSDSTKSLMSASRLGHSTSKETKEKIGGKRRDRKNNSSASKYFGVYLNSRAKVKKWNAHVSLIWKIRFYLGAFENEKDAAIAYDNFVKKHELPFPLNFPND